MIVNFLFVMVDKLLNCYAVHAAAYNDIFITSEAVLGEENRNEGTS